MSMRQIIVSKYFLKWHQNKIGPYAKLSSKDELLMTMMKLRLNLLVTDLSQRFEIPDNLCTQDFYS